MSGRGWGHTYLKVDNGDGGAVSPAHNAVEILQARGQEGAEGAGQPDLPSLLEALEIGAPDAAHATTQRGVQGHQVKLPREDNGGLRDASLATTISSPWPACGTHGRLEVLVHVGGHRGRIWPAVDVVPIDELLLVVQQGLLGQAVLVGHHLIPPPGTGSSWGDVVAERVQGPVGLGASIVERGRLVVHLIVLQRGTRHEGGHGAPGGDGDGECWGWMEMDVVG